MINNLHADENILYIVWAPLSRFDPLKENAIVRVECNVSRALSWQYESFNSLLHIIYTFMNERSNIAEYNNF